MASYAASVSNTPEWQVFTTSSRDDVQLQECNFILYHKCTDGDSCESLKLIGDIWFAKRNMNGVKELRRRSERPFRGCENMEMLKSRSQQYFEKRAGRVFPDSKLGKEQWLERPMKEHEHMEMLKTVNQQSFEKRAGCVFPDTEVRKAIVPYGKDYAENQ